MQLTAISIFSQKNVHLVFACHCQSTRSLNFKMSGYFVVFSIAFGKYFAVPQNWVKDLNWEKCVNNSLNHNQKYRIYFCNIRNQRGFPNENIFPDFTAKLARHFKEDGCYMCTLTRYFGNYYSFVFLRVYNVLLIKIKNKLQLFMVMLNRFVMLEEKIYQAPYTTTNVFSNNQFQIAVHC